jgi:hypothetical protein
VRCLELVYTSNNGVCKYGCPNVEVFTSYDGFDIGEDFCLYGCDNLKTLSVRSSYFLKNFCKNGCNSLTNIYANGSST